MTLSLLLAPPASSLEAQAGGASIQLPPGTDSVGAVQAAEPAVYLLTFGPGDLVYEVWAHNAIWVRDPARGIDHTYNWGIFDFDQEGFIGRLARGTMLYRMDDFPIERTIAEYTYYNRSIWAQELNLTGEQKRALVEYLLETDTEENRYYRYDYFRDNCSTRVRDALDRVLGGRIADALSEAPAGVTWRWHARRILRNMPASYAGMEFALGNPADESITRWDETFLPLELMAHIRDVTVLDEAGLEVPLVKQEMEIFRATRAPEPDAPPFWLPWFLVAGVVVAGVVAAASGAFRAPEPAARGAGESGRGGAGLVVAGGVATLWSLVVGLAGVFLLTAWLFTDHTFWYRNENLLQASPLSLLLALLLLVGHFRRGAPTPWLGRVALGVLGLSVLGLVLQALPGFDQVNGEIIALALPVHAAVAWLALQLGRARARPA